jgi:hypothetical protein
MFTAGESIPRSAWEIELRHSGQIQSSRNFQVLRGRILGAIKRCC